MQSVLTKLVSSFLMFIFGLISGVIGSTIGYYLRYLSLPLISWLPRNIPIWGFVGFSIGVLFGLTKDSIREKVYGIIGGSLGGILAGILQALVSRSIRWESDTVSIAGAILGLLLGGTVSPRKFISIVVVSLFGLIGGILGGIYSINVAPNLGIRVWYMMRPQESLEFFVFMGAVMGSLISGFVSLGNVIVSSFLIDETAVVLNLQD